MTTDWQIDQNWTKWLQIDWVATNWLQIDKLTKIDQWLQIDYLTKKWLMTTDWQKKWLVNYKLTND